MSVLAPPPIPPAELPRVRVRGPAFPPPIPPDVWLYQVSVEQYHEMTRSGVLTKDDRVELIEGVLVQKMTLHPPHASSVRKCNAAIPPLLPPGWFYDVQLPVTLGDSEPEPDGMVVRGSPGDYEERHPTPDDVALVIEISDSSLALDRGRKLRAYARASVRLYWLLNLIDRVLEVYTDPRPDAEEPTYGSRQTLTADDSVALTIGGVEVGVIPVASLLPKHVTAVESAGADGAPDATL